MYVLLTGLIILNLFFGFIDAIVTGASDYQVTRLTAALSDNATVMYVKSTAGYRVVDWARLGNEKVRYNGKTTTSFLNLVRGYDSTTPAAHNVGNHVYGRISDAVNSSAGFNIVNTGASVGTIDTMTLVTSFVTTAVPAMIQWNFYWMKEGFWQYLRLLCVGVSLAIVIILALQLLSALGGLLQSAFRR